MSELSKQQTKGSNVLLLPLNFRHSFRTKLRPISTRQGWLFDFEILKYSKETF